MGRIDVYPPSGGSGGGGADIFSSATAPSSPFADDLWLDTDESTSTGLSSILAHTEFTNAPTTTSATDVVLASITVTVPAGRRLRLSAYGYLATSVADTDVRVVIKEGATALADGGGSIKFNAEANPTAIISPTAGTHTYTLAWRRTGGTGTLTFYGATTVPGFLMAEDITGTLWPAGQSIGAGTIASEAWTDYVPTLTQSVTVTKTVTYARYLRVGRMITVQVGLAVTSSGTANNIVKVGLPVPAAVSAPSIPIGTFHINDAGVAAYSGMALFDSTTEVKGIANADPQYLGVAGADFAAALVSGDSVGMSITYEAAT